MSPSKPWRTVLLGESTGRFSREQIRAAVLEVKAENESSSGAAIDRETRADSVEPSGTTPASSRETLATAPRHPFMVHDRAGLASLLSVNLGAVDRISASLCRRYGLTGDDADDFASWARLRLVEDDYAILSKFRGESSLDTYFTVVVSMLFREYRIRKWGRWRPSAAAQRLGPLAIRLETLIYRDGSTLSQAGEVIRSEGLDVSDRELTTLLAQLPTRGLPRPTTTGFEALAAVSSPEHADDIVASEEAARHRQRTLDALLRAIEHLPPEDQAIVRMRLWEDRSVADISRSLNLPQKPLYRRIERVLSALRRDLEESGVTREQVRMVFDDEGP